MAALTVVVTRPGAAGATLVEELRRAGLPALWLPAFDFGPPPDEAAARATLARLADFDLAIFVSPQAARATAALLAAAWPPATAIATVGGGTTRAVLAAVTGAAQARLLAPLEADDDPAGSGSESLWPLLQAMQPPPRRVLLLRAQAGRQWLAERLQAIGASVLPLAVYTRRPVEPTAAQRAELAAAAQGNLASVLSSSDAVEALVAQLATQPAVLRALRAGPALATHPRIVERLRAAGFARPLECGVDAAAIVAALRAGRPLESAAPGGQRGDER